MRNILFILCCFFSGLLLADNVTVEQAQSLAANFFRASTQTRSASPQLQLVWDGEDPSTRTSATEPAFYVFNRTDSKGFIIVAGDDVAMPVLGYSFENSFKTENMPANLKNWLLGLKDQINEARNNHFTASATTEQAWKNASDVVGDIEVELETAKWNQDAPYNDKCPMLSGERTVTGCVATAIAIIMKYHEWPDCGEGTLESYTYKAANGSTQTVPSHTLGHAYNWNNMPLVYDKSTSAESEQEVATLMYDCGVMSKATYNVASTGGTGATTQNAITGMINHMKYDKGARILYRSWYSDSEWHKMVKEELEAHRPVLYGGSNKRNEGHQFVLNGYTSNNYFSVNWGWGGYSNGYYLLSGLNPNDQGIGGNTGGFTVGQDAVFGLKKAESSSEYADILAIAQSTEGGKGLYTNEKNIQTGKEFTISAEYIFNFGLSTFNGEIVVTLFDKNGQVKEDISEIAGVQDLDPFHGVGGDIPCTITQPIKGGDRIKMRFKGSKGTEWQVMPAYDESIPGEILVREEIASVEEATSFTYNKTSKIITLNTAVDIAYKLTSNDNKVIKEGTTDASGEIKIDTNELEAGTYTIVLTGEEDSKTLNFTIGNK